MRSVLFVCLGNICRSPLAEGVFRDFAARTGRTAEFAIDSAGTGAWHAGSPPDPRSIAIARVHGIDIAGQRARQVTDADFDRFDLIVAMDRDNLASLKRQAGPAARARVRLLIDHPPTDVPDPYYGGADSFETVYRLIRDACETLVE